MVIKYLKHAVDQAKAWPAGLIVVGTHGLSGVERLVIGSDAETVVRKSPIPVLLVKMANIVRGNNHDYRQNL